MNAPVINMPETIVSDDVLKDVEALAKRTSPEEAIWISGYFSGWAKGRLAPSDDAAHLVSTTKNAGANNKEKFAARIIYGSETGNSVELAEKLSAMLNTQGYTVECNDIADYKIQSLKNESYLFIITSTHGDGDPPETAKPFFEALAGRKAPKLDHLQYAVLGLGDSSYEHFCVASKYIDERFSELGAKPLFERIECDVDYEELAENWFENIKVTLKETVSIEQQQNPATSFVATVDSDSPAKQKYDKRNPFSANVVENINLTGRGSSKEIHHLEFSLDDSGLKYLPGDSLGVVPVNSSEVVDEILSALNLTGNENINSENKTLRESLLRDYEITRLTSRFIENWYALTEANDLKKFLPSQGRALLFDYAESNHIIDVIRKYPVADIDPIVLLKGFRTLQPRLYSISSSQDAVEDEVHITVAKLEYELHQTLRHGVASSYLCAEDESEQTMKVYIQNNNNFRLPTDTSVPIIMIGAGTGIAPYRAFMQQREFSNVKDGAAWLFFGERNFRTDFLYQTEWQEWLRNGYLDRISLAFSRDGKDKIYVQHRMIENGKDIFKWLEEGANIYVCGDASHMAKDVNATLLNIIQNEGKMSSGKADEYLQTLISNKRYLKDVY